MARLYNAGQYNQEFLPRRLGNWEVPKWFPERKPRDPFSFKPTEPIVDDRGRFLPGAPRANRNPWNNYIGTHDQPPRITRAIANDLASRPPARLRYWDKPNTRLRPVACTATQLQGGPGFSLVAEGPGFPQHRSYFLNKKDYEEHTDRVDEQDVVAVEFLKERKRRQDAVKERVEQVKELTAALRQQQEQRRRDDAERDVQWLLKNRALHNVVPRTHDWSRGAPRTAGCDRAFMEISPAARVPRQRGQVGGGGADSGSPRRETSSGRLLSARSSAGLDRCSPPGSPVPEDTKHAKASERCWGPGAGGALEAHDDEGIHEGHEEHEDREPDVRDSCWERNVASDDPVRDDGQDSGVGSVDDGHSRDESPELNPKPVAGATGAAPYPQYEEDSGDLLKPSNPAYPTVDPGFSRRAARDPTIQGYPEPERVREQGYPEMFTTETDLAAPAEAEDRDQSPPPPAQREPTLPRVEGAALKCGRYPRRGNPPPRPYARAQFAVVAPEPESPADSPQQRVPTPGPALANAYSSFQVAKQLHKENLEHNPLPDTVNDDLFKKLNSQRHPNPGIALDVVPDAAAVGWRSFNAPGPTNCSKMKVYRPKTAAPAGIRHNGLQERMQRPSTGHPGKLLAKDHVSEMDLAICWDLVPAFAEDEPKPTPHIDGSNGSAAPGIFSLVHHPADNEEDVCADRGPRASARANGSGHCSGGPRRTSTPPAAMERRTPPKPPSVESVHSGSGSGQHKHAAANGCRSGSGCGPPDHALHERLHAQERQRAAVQRRYNEQRVAPHAAPADAARELADFRKRNGCYAGMQGCGDGTTRDDPRNLNDHLVELRKNRHHHQSMPDLSEHQQRYQRHRSASHHRHGHNHNHNPRPCAACCKVPSPPPLRRPKSEYKMAFKAGKPATSLSTNSSFDTPPSQHSGGCNGAGGCSGAAVRVPKQRAPFARKNYAITSLTQPFSLWPKETGHAYPEHWRLASVYQHSFKPVHARSKPLLKTVYQ